MLAAERLLVGTGAAPRELATKIRRDWERDLARSSGSTPRSVRKATPATLRSAGIKVKARATRKTPDAR
jgi:hypothetical protein